MSEVANAQVAVFPTFQGFRSKVTAEVSGVALDAGKQFTSSFKGAASIEVDTSRLKRAVGQAGATLARARQQQATSAGKVRVAEAQLSEAITKTGKSSARTVAAEEKLAAANRALETSSERTERATKDLAEAQGRLSKASASAGAAGQQAANQYVGGWRGVKERVTAATSGGMKKAGAKAGAAFKVGAVAGVAAIGTGIIAATGAAVDILKNSIDEATESAKVTAITENAIKKTGAAAWVSAQQIGDLSQALSNKTGIDDEAIQSSANLLLTFKQVRNEAGKGNDVFNRATAAAQDLAAAGFGDADSAAKMLGKSLNDPVKGMAALGRAGVTFTASQKKRIQQYVQEGNLLGAQKMIMKEVESQVGGAAAASSTAAEKLATTWGNLQEDMGTALLPAVNRVAVALGPVLTRAVNAAMPAIESLGDAIEGTIQWLEANPAVMEAYVSGFSLAGDAISGLAQILGPVLGFAAKTAIRGFSALAQSMSYMLAALGNVPGFEWAQKASAQLADVARGADALVAGIDQLGQRSPVIDVSARDRATKKLQDVDKKIKALKDKKMTLSAADKASGKAKELQKKIDRLEDKKIRLTAEVRKTGISKISIVPRGGNNYKVTALASGGLFRGLGTGTSDSNLALLSDREFVMRAAAARKIGTKTLDWMNKTGNVPMVPVAAGGGGGAPTIIQGNVYGDHYLAQITRRSAVKSQHMMQREGLL